MAGLVMPLDPAMPLPALRQDLQQADGAVTAEGDPTFLVFDPLRNRYFRFDSRALALLHHWRPGQSARWLAEQLTARGFDLTAGEVTAIAEFLIQQHLTVSQGEAGVARLLQARSGSRSNWWRWLLKNYLFIRIPLFRPNDALNRWAPRLEWLFRPTFLTLVGLLGAIGLFLVVRQWDAFKTTFLHFFSWEGLGLYLLALVVVKACHELGHALMAKRLGCRVASMGVAFLVLFPVLYTDTTDAWKLQRRRDRLLIGSAGMLTELVIALLATFAWSFLEDGALRSAAFFLATTSWVTSLLINLTPFMRFDGYYLMADWLQEDNLQPRAFALGRWRLRELLFGLGEPAPEVLPARRRRLLIVYAWMTWVYRFFLFLGIALLVYFLTFKVLGILLFLAEIHYFILGPIVREVKQWWKRRAMMGWNRNSIGTVSALAALMLLALLPWHSRVQLPAVLHAEQTFDVFSPEPARVEAMLVGNGDQVDAGQPLLRLESDALALRRVELETEIGLLRQEIDRSSSEQQRSMLTAVLEDRLAARESALAGLRDRQERLLVRAPTAGIVRDLATIASGQWLGDGQRLLVIVDGQKPVVTGLVDARNLARIQSGASAVFLADHGLGERLPLAVQTIDTASVERLLLPELSSLHGGPVPVRAGAGPADALRPDGAWYRITLSPASAVSGDAVVLPWRTPGRVVVEAPARSFAQRLFERVVSILIRESGF